MTRDEWTQVQARLHKLGFNPGPIDGLRGRLTTTAVRRFQASRGLVADGIVGPNTLRALFEGQAEPAPAGLDAMPWFEEARRLVGTVETPGAGSTQAILDWADGLEIHYPGDDIPWCGLFVGHCVGATLPDEGLPAAVLRARAWERFGRPCAPQMGAVMVFWRTSLASGNGHVGFYAGEDPGAFLILGGNQSDAVNTVRVSRDRFLGARWPLTALPPGGETRVVDAGGALSTNEA